MTDYLPVRTIEDARHCVEQAKSMLERARFMWTQANKTVEEAKLMRADLQAQIEELAKRGTSRRQLKRNLLSGILDAAVEGTGADMGNIQLFDPKTVNLLIYVHRGFDEPFLEFFNSVHAGQAACGTALKYARRVFVRDVADSLIFSSTDCLEVVLDAGVRAVQSTPLISKSGRIWGMLSTHHRKVNEPRKKDLRLIDRLAAWAADILEAGYRPANPHADAVTAGGNGFQTAGVFASTED